MLVLPSELTHEHAATCCRSLTQGLQSQQEGTAAVVDAAALTKFDSSALAVLLECRRQALAMGKTFAIAGLPKRLRELAALYGVAQLLPEPLLS